MPGAINCPVLDDQQRAEIGTKYVQESPFIARKDGAVLVARNIAMHIEEKFSDKEKNWHPLIYCWRGGQRSGAMQTILRQVGWNATLLKGGYKAYRSNVLVQLDDLVKQFKYVAIGGPTGSGKTMLLKIMATLGAQVLDLEGMAGHKGSVLGHAPTAPAQSQKSFDTQLVKALSAFDSAFPVYVETESRKIGMVHLPSGLHEAIKKTSVVILEVPMEERIKFLCNDYTWCIEHPEKLKEKLSRLKKVRGKETIEKWFEMIDLKNWEALTQDLLEVHYDPLYKKSGNKGLNNETNKHFISAKHISEEEFSSVAKKIIQLLA